jgi:hypothetical protein
LKALSAIGIVILVRSGLRQLKGFGNHHYCGLVGLKGTVVVDLLWIPLLASELWILRQCLFSSHVALTSKFHHQK